MNKLAPQELDERIADLDVSMDEYNVNTEQVKQLIRDCIEAVTPEPLPPTTHQVPNPHGFYNQAIHTIQANTKELLG